MKREEGKLFIFCLLYFRIIHIILQAASSPCIVRDFITMVQPFLRQICALWLVLPRSGFCSTDRFHENSPSRVFSFKQSRQIQKFGPKQRKKKRILSFFSAKPPEKAKKIEILQRFQRCMKKTNTVSE